MGRGCVKTILGSLTSQKTRTTVPLLGTRYLRTANESTLMHVLFLSEEFSHSLCPLRSKSDSLAIVLTDVFSGSFEEK